ncbi:MAG TPA: F0F1 ATP synthase subunit delta [Candidatus Saccharimonadales bacterium]|nr:F0F1 ATP synthase subunit delta [Candidatus Saccharimonadales bacterium]
MKTPRHDIAETIAAHTYYKGIEPEYVRQIAAMLLEEGRVGELESLLRDIQANWADHGYVEVLARTAHALSEAEKSEIATQIQALYPHAEKIAVTEVHDPEVIGGVRLSLANQQLDMTVEAKMNKFKQLTAAGKEQ